jgi:predicted transcriptional regulator
MIDLQENLGAILKERGILHKNVAQAMGVTDAAVSNWFNRTVELKFSTISQICEKFKIPVVDVVTYPKKYIPQDSVNPECEECRKKDEMIENLTELLRRYKAEAKQKPKKE